MTEFDYDLFTIGAGSGGVRASRLSAAFGARVGVAEASRPGGTCVIRGCVPKKLLVYGAHFAEEFTDAEAYGWTVAGTGFDWASLIRNKDKEINRLEQVYIKLLEAAGCRIYPHRAHLLDAHTVRVGTHTVRAKNILIAVGGWPALPDIPGIEHAITSNEALDLKALPRRMVIVGGGYIAVEFAGIFAALGVEVTQVLRADGILRGFDQDLRSALAAEMTKKGVALRCETRIVTIDKRGGVFTLLTDANEEIETDLVMYATGRAPNTSGLGLAEAGVDLDPRGAVIVDEYSRSSVPHIFAIGDVTDRINLTPVAINEGRMLAETLFNKRPMRMDYDNVPSAIFSQPPCASVGLTEEQARARYGAVDIYKSSFTPMKYSLSGRPERSVMKLVVDAASDRVLGCHMVGVDAPEIIQGLAVALKCGATKAQFDATVGIHPTAAEEFVTLRDKAPGPDADTAE